MMALANTQPRDSTVHLGEEPVFARAASHTDLEDSHGSMATLFGRSEMRLALGLISCHPGEGVTSAAKSVQAFLIQELGQPSTLLNFEDLDCKDAKVPSLDPRGRKEAVLVDCGSLESSANFLKVTPIVDGFILVRAVGRNTATDVHLATKIIQAAGSSIAGVLLTKVRPSKVSWLDDFFSAKRWRQQ